MIYFIDYVNIPIKGLMFQCLIVKYHLGLIMPVSNLVTIKFIYPRYCYHLTNFTACVFLAYCINCFIKQLIFIVFSHSLLLLGSSAINVLMDISRPKQRKQRIFVRNAGVLVEAKNVLRPPDIGVSCLVT